MNSKLTTALLLCGAILAGLWIVAQLYPEADPLGGLALPLDVDSLKTRANQIVKALDIPTRDLVTGISLKRKGELIRQLHEEHGIPRGNGLLREGVPGFYWVVTWRRPEDIQLSFGNSNGSDAKGAKTIRAIMGELRLCLGPRGELLELKRGIPDTLRLLALSTADARKCADDFLFRFTTLRRPQTEAGDGSTPAALVFLNERKIEQPNRTDYELTWAQHDSVSGDTIQTKVTVAGNVILGFSREYLVPERFRSVGGSTFRDVTEIVLALAFIALGLVVAFKRIRAFEIGFRLALLLGAAAMIGGVFEKLSELPPGMGWPTSLVMVLVGLFIGGGLVLVWAVAESIGRETRNERFISIDLLARGYILHSRVGEALLRGIALGVLACALYPALVLAARVLIPVSFMDSDDAVLSFAASEMPAMQILGSGMYRALYLVAVFLLFAVSYLEQRISSIPLQLAVAAATFGVMNSLTITPVAAGMLIGALVGLVFIWTYYRCDVLTSIVALLTFSVLDTGMSLFMAGNPALLQSGENLLGLLVGTLAVACVGILTRDKVVDFDRVTPAFARLINEHQRLKQELEIAREVQRTLLPKKDPEFPGLDIASRCAPAQEVGGDYYDFVRIGDHSLGVVVGDVSGKGTQAAFFMTLTKGFLKAVAGGSHSPAHVLTEANRLFCENVERGTFISMVYGVFDTAEHTLTLARAGHNPVITRKSAGGSPEVLHPTGLALGLEGGELFGRSIQEVTVRYAPGDIFVFYTDGFTEAMNELNEEFGQARLSQSVEVHSGGPAREIMEGVFSDVDVFAKKVKPHDDMTIVVVKVK